MNIHHILRLVLSYIGYEQTVEPRAIAPGLKVMVHGEISSNTGISMLCEELAARHTVLLASSKQSVELIKSDTFRLHDLGSIETKDFASAYKQVFPQLSNLVDKLKPDLMVCDASSPVCRDIAEFKNIPTVTLVENIDELIKDGIVKAPYLTNSPDAKSLTTNSLSGFQKFHDSIIAPVKNLLRERVSLSQLNKVRSKFNIPPSYALQDTSRSLVFVNSFIGLDPAVSLPSHVKMIGPLINPSYSELSSDLAEFLDSHNKILLVSSQQTFTSKQANQLFDSACQSLKDGTVNGIIWDIKLPTAKSKNSNNQIFILNSSNQAENLLKHSHTRAVATSNDIVTCYSAIRHNKPVIFLPGPSRLALKLTQAKVSHSLSNYKMLHSVLATVLSQSSLNYNFAKFNALASASSYRINWSIDQMEILVLTAQACRSSKARYGTIPCELDHLVEPTQSYSLIAYYRIDAYLALISIFSAISVIASDILIRYYRRISKLKHPIKQVHDC